MKIKIIPHYSKDYWKCVRLRDKILREPLHLMFSEEELFLENNQIHIANFEENHVTGCLSLVKIDSETLKMRQVCVSEEKQGKGIGSEMIKFAENWARNNHFQQIECNARESAVPFYLNHHYSKIGESFKEVGLVHYKMKKSL